MPESTMSLGKELRRIRGIHKLTLRTVEELTGISNAYLSQLESDKIKQPSPHYLYKLAAAYNVPYDALMEKAGYITPSQQEKPKKDSFLSGVEVTEEEEAELLNYLAYLRSKTKQKGQN